MPRITHTQFVARLKECNSSIEVLGEYIKSSERVCVQCKKCGYIWNPVAAELLRGKGCPSCKGNLKMTTEDFVSRMSKINSDIEIVGEYVRSNVKIECRCQLCGNVWSAIPSSLLHGHGCPNCAINERSAKRRKTQEQFESDLHKINPNIKVIGQYCNSSSPVDVQCSTCGHKWSPIARSIVNAGQGCPICSRKKNALRQTKSHQTFVFEMAEINPDIEIVDSYKGSKTKIGCRCHVCGNTWKAAPSNLLNGYGCPRCAKTGTSFMEQFLCVFFEILLGDGEVLSRDKNTIGRELDIVLPSFALAIEIGSWYWHKNRLDSDREKQLLCEHLGFDLITILDSCPETDSAKLPRGAILYSCSLNNDTGYIELRSLAIKLAERIGVNVPSDLDWDAIRTKASRRALPKTTEEFLDEIGKTNPQIEILGNYTGSKSKIECRCKVCENEWRSTAGQLLRGQGCPVCGHKRAALQAAEYKRKTPEDYAKEFREKNPELILLSDYTGSLNPVKVKCTKCDHEWSPRAEAIIRGNGCPVCANNVKRKTQETFLQELQAINPSIEVLGSYLKNSTPIEVRCKRCNNVWHPRPVKLLAGQGCPKCAGKAKRPVRCIETGEVYKSFSEAGRAVGLSSGDLISAVCKGKRKTAGGYTWETLDTSSHPNN